MTFTSLASIRRSQYVNSIRICVARSWRPKKYLSDTDDGIHYVLVDEKGDSVHAIVEEHDYMHTTKMKTGCMYDIYHVHVKGVNGGYKVVDRDIEIGFNEMSTIVPISPDACSIPKFAYNFVVFNEIESCFENQQQMEKEKKRILLADIYGCIKEVTPPCTLFITGRNDYETICEVMLENHRRETVKITLWSEIAKKFDVKAVEQSKSPTFAVFTSLRMKKFKGNITSTGTNHTCIIFNPHLPQFADYTTEFNKPGDKVRIRKFYNGLKKDEAWKSVLDLRTLDPGEYKDRIVFCCAKILRFPNHSGWWYNSCSVPRCFKQMKQKTDGSGFYCPVHRDQLSTPAYRVYMTIKDDSDQITLTLIGRQAEALFGYSCLDLLKSRENADSYEIVGRVGQTYLFELKIGYNNEFVVMDIHADRNTIEEAESEGGNSVTSKNMRKAIGTNQAVLAMYEEPDVLTPAMISDRKRFGPAAEPDETQGTAREVAEISLSKEKKQKRLEKGASSAAEPTSVIEKDKID